MNSSDLKDWLNAWQDMKKKATIIIEQADIIIPVAEQKIKELEEEENGE